LCLHFTADGFAQDAAQPARTGQQVYETICAACHGPDGRGGTEMAKTIPLPDFTDCSFASREPDDDWLAVAHYGGPARGFSPIMPAWLGTMTAEELQLTVSHIRTFCTDDRWPRGELNLPRPLFTSKAFPEDEAVVTVDVVSDGPGAVVTELLYERRFGPLNQVEIAVPIASVERPAGGSSRGLGDIALGYKRTLAHSLSRGNIVSVSGEVILPTGSDSKGLGGGTTVLEPFVTFGQLLRGGSFLQAQAGFEIPTDADRESEAFWRVALGRSLSQPRFGRTWSPAVELLASRALESGATTHWDLVPQMQVTLNARQHIMLSAGVRLPVNDREGRSTRIVTYLLWDWFDGGFFDGW
jgi:hypothetical protein